MSRVRTHTVAIESTNIASFESVMLPVTPTNVSSVKNSMRLILKKHLPLAAYYPGARWAKACVRENVLLDSKSFVLR